MMFTVKQARVLAGKTQQQIAEAIGVHRTTYFHLEQHPETMSVLQLVRFCQAVGRDTSEIFLPTTLEK